MLWSPKSIDKDQSKAIIKKCWKKAKGQIGNHVSVLVIGGIFIPKESLDNLERSARQFLDNRKNTSVAFIVILSVTVLLRDPVIKGTQIGVGAHSSAVPQFIIRRVKNKHYKGIVTFFDSGKKSEETEKITEFRIY